jgi:DNA-binding GntR family transcriptional regulator
VARGTLGPAMATPLKHRPLREVVTDEIRRMITDGEIAAGERLVEDRLAEQLGVSRNPVREAIRSLEATGLVEVLPRRGAYVTVVDLDDMAQLQEMRQVIDRWVVQAAAERHDATDVERLDTCIREGRLASEAGDPVRASEMHREFHLAIEAASKNPYASIAMGPLRQRTEMVFTSNNATRAAISWSEHQGIRDAIAARDGILASQRIEEHIRNAFEAFAASRSVPAGATATA